jgi:hypothetical protein
MNGQKECGIYTHNVVLVSQKKKEIMSFAGKWMELKIIILSEINQIHTHKYPIFSHMQTHMIKARAHKGGVRIGKTPKKLASICCP